MKNKNLKTFLGSLIMSVMLFNSFVPYYVRAEGEESVVYDSAEQDAIFGENSMDSDEEEIPVPEGKDISVEDIVWNEPTADWYEDYEYTINDYNKRIYLNAAKENLAGNIVIPGTATINGVKYEVVLGPRSYSFKDYGLWAKCADSITGIKIEEGVKADQNSSFLFSCLSNLVYIDQRGLDTSEVCDMQGLYRDCVKLNNLDVSMFDTSNVTNMAFMFGGCRSIENLDVTGFNTKNVTVMSGLFNECKSLKSIDVHTFDTSKVTAMWSMFCDCSSITSLDLSNFDTSNVTDMLNMFRGCSSLQSINLSGFDTSKAVMMNGLFSDCSSIETIDISNIDTSSAITINDMFYGCRSLKEIDLSGFDTSNVTSLRGMFFLCENLTSVNVSSFNTSKVEDMGAMFGGCQSLKALDVSNFDTSGVVEMAEMFEECSSLTSIDVSGFDTSNVKNMNSMFYGDWGLKSLDLSNFDTSKVEIMEGMFFNCYGLKELDLSNFDTSNVTDMMYMFGGCYGLNILDLSGWNTSNVTNMKGMFISCYGLDKLDIRNFAVNESCDATGMMMDSAKERYLPLAWIKGYDHKECELEDMHHHERFLKKIYYPGTEEQWDDLQNIIPEGVEVVCKSASQNQISANKVILDKAVLNMKIGDDPILLKAYVEPQDATDVVYRWSSSDTTVASVSNKGLVSAVGVGDSVVTVFIEGTDLSASCNVSVRNRNISDNVLNKIILNKESLLLTTKDEPVQLIASVEPEGIDVELVWASSDDNVATVSSYGIVTPVGKGNAIISVSANGIVAECNVEVKSYQAALTPAPDLDDTATELHLVKGQKFTLEGSGWISSDERYVSISKKNIVSAKKITTTPVKLTRGEQSIDVYVTKPAMGSKSISLKVGEEKQVVFNYDSENLPVLWYSSAPDIATISQNGIVTAHSKGTATITAYVYGAAYTCKVKVSEPVIAFERSLHITLNTSKTISLKGIKKPLWTADNKGIVTIKGNKIKGIDIGKTTLHAEYDGKEYLIHLYVEDPTISTKDIKASGKNKYTVNLKSGDIIPIEYSFVDQEVVYKSNKGENAYYDNGSIVANKPGKAKLTAKVNGKTITINVTVVD